MERLISDLKFVLRSYMKSPLFAAVAVLSLALGIGANAAIFSLLDQVLLRSWPVKDPQQLVAFDWDGKASGFLWNTHTFSYPMYKEFRDGSKEWMDGVAARFVSPVDVGWNGGAERKCAELVTGNYFDVLGVGAALGRPFTPDDDRVKNAEPYVVLSFGYWQKRFGGSAWVLNRTIDVNHRPMTIVGVAQRGFRGTDTGSPADLFVPMMMKPAITPTWDDLEERRAYWLSIIGRMKPVSRRQALAGMTMLYRRGQLEDLKVNPNATERFRKTYLNNKFMLTDTGLLSSIRDQFSTPLIVLMAMVGTLLLIACGNVANLLVARAASRQKEIAIRLSLGASKGSIVRLVLTESLTLSLMGGGLGLLVAAWSGSLLLKLLPFETFSQAVSTAPDGRVLIFTSALSLATAVLFGLTPALQIAKPDVIRNLRNESRPVAGGGNVALRKGMVAAQISLSLLLLIGAGLFARSLYNLLQSSPGMQTENVLQFSVDPSLAGYSDQKARQLFRELRQELSAMPGAVSVSGAANPVLADDESIRSTQAEGFRPSEGEDVTPDVNQVLPDFFSTLGVPLVAGREFDERDTFGAHKAAIVNQSFAETFFRGQNPLGRHIGFGGRPETTKLDMEIVGVVKDAKSRTMKEKVHRQVYTPVLQAEPAALTFYIRTAGDANRMARMARRVVARRDPGLPVFDVKTIAGQIRETHYADRLITMLSIAFGFLATLLAAVGLYGVMAFSVARRTRELGIRMALGAQRAQVLRMVMKEVLLLAAIGVGAALPVAVALGRSIQGQLFQLKASDPGILCAATALLATVALAAGYIPAFRATRVDPMKALRWE